MTDLRKLRRGAILSTSWGYDQTQYNYAKVERNTGKTIFVKMIGAQTVRSGGVGQSWVKPNPSVVQPQGNAKLRIAPSGEYAVGKYPYCWNAPSAKKRGVFGIAKMTGDLETSD